MAETQRIKNRRLIDEAMRWHNRAVVAHDRELGSIQSQQWLGDRAKINGALND